MRYDQRGPHPGQGEGGEVREWRIGWLEPIMAFRLALSSGSSMHHGYEYRAAKLSQICECESEDRASALTE